MQVNVHCTYTNIECMRITNTMKIPLKFGFTHFVNEKMKARTDTNTFTQPFEERAKNERTFRFGNKINELNNEKKQLKRACNTYTNSFYKTEE